MTVVEPGGEGLGEAEYNPFLEDGRTADRDEETAGLALAATIAGGDGDGDEDADGNPFLSGEAAPAAAEEDEANPFLAEDDGAAEATEPAEEKEDAPA